MNRDEYVQMLKTQLDAWTEMTRGADDAWKQMRDAFNQASSKFGK